jgi:hypothetical protein
VEGWAGCVAVYKKNGVWRGKKYALGQVPAAVDAELHAIFKAVNITWRQACESCATVAVYSDSHGATQKVEIAHKPKASPHSTVGRSRAY